MLSRIRTRGCLYSVGIVINRVVPESLFRFRIFRIFEIGVAAERRADGDQRGNPGPESDLQLRFCEVEADFEAARALTHFRPGAGDVGREGETLRACLAQDWASPVGGVWIASDHFDERELGIRIRLPESAGWIFAAFVAKSHRRRGIYRRLLNHAVTNDPADPAVFYCSINPTNKASIAAHKPFIRKTAGTCVAARFLKWPIAIAWGGLRVERTETGKEVVIG